MSLHNNSDWAWRRLGEIADVTGGFAKNSKHVPSDPVRVPYLRVANVQRGYLDLSDVTEIVVDRAVAEKLALKNGDLLLTEGGDRDKLGRGWIWQCQIEGCIHQNHIFRARLLVGDIDPELLSLYANHAGPRYFHRVASQTVNLASVSLNKLRAFEVPVIPVTQQRQIKSKIDELFSRIDEGERALKTVETLVERYRQSVLKAAVTGQLTRDWREAHQHEFGKTIETGEQLLARILKARREAWEKAELSRLIAKGKPPKSDAWKKKYKEAVQPATAQLPKLPENWIWASLDQVADVVGGVTVDKKRATEGCIEVPYLRVANVQRGYLNLDEVKVIRVPQEKAEPLYLKPGDILLNEGGDIDKLGRGWIWEGQIQACIHQNHVFRARLFTPSQLNVVISWFANVLGQRIFMSLGKQTTNLASLSLSKLKSFPVPISSTEEVAALRTIADAAVQAIEKTIEEMATTQKTSSALRQSTLAAAFCGRLTRKDS